MMTVSQYIAFIFLHDCLFCLLCLGSLQNDGFARPVEYQKQRLA